MGGKCSGLGLMHSWIGVLLARLTVVIPGGMGMVNVVMLLHFVIVRAVRTVDVMDIPVGNISVWSGWMFSQSHCICMRVGSWGVLWLRL